MRLAAAASLLFLLAACGSSSGRQESRVGKFLVAPGKYQLYDCKQLAVVAGSYVNRQKDLREVKAKAEAGSAGTLISMLAYDSEYAQVQGNLDDLRREVTEKKCNPPPPGLMPEGSAPAIVAGPGR